MVCRTPCARLSVLRNVTGGIVSVELSSQKWKSSVRYQLSIEGDRNRPCKMAILAQRHRNGFVVFARAFADRDC
jgi:hypothetical protein